MLTQTSVTICGYNELKEINKTLQTKSNHNVYISNYSYSIHVKGYMAEHKCWPFFQCPFPAATMRIHLALALFAALICYVMAAPRRPFRGPAMGRVPNHEGPHHRRPKVSNCTATSQCLVIMPHIDGILPKGPYPPCLRMADRTLLVGYARYDVLWDQRVACVAGQGARWLRLFIINSRLIEPKHVLWGLFFFVCVRSNPNASWYILPIGIRRLLP